MGWKERVEAKMTKRNTETGKKTATRATEEGWKEKVKEGVMDPSTKLQERRKRLNKL